MRRSRQDALIPLAAVGLLVLVLLNVLPGGSYLEANAWVGHTDAREIAQDYVASGDTSPGTAFEAALVRERETAGVRLHEGDRARRERRRSSARRRLAKASLGGG
jgi:hypothetical protein